MTYNAFGLRVRTPERTRPVPGTESMTKPVRCCHCRTVYDIGTVAIVDRYTDCSTWRCPGCNLLVDDRCEYAPGWSARRDYNVLPRGGGRR